MSQRDRVVRERFKVGPMLNAPERNPGAAHYVEIMTTFIWVGFVGAISFMEAWLKFRAPGVSLAVGLNIGRLIFAALNKVEWVMALMVVICVLVNPRRLRVGTLTLLCIPIAILTVQSLFFLPVLNQRAEALSQGLEVSRSFVHFYYLFVEVVKCLCLVWLGLRAARDLIPEKGYGIVNG